MPMSAAQQQAQQMAQLAAANNTARQLIVSRAILRKNQIYTQAGITPANTPTLQIPIQYVGLVLGFLVLVSGTAAVASGSATVTELGPANLLSQVQFQDLNNNTRIQTAGWHLHLNQSAKRHWPYLAARTNSSYPVDFGSNWPVIAAPTLATSGTFNMAYWVPLAYSPFDLRGSVYANVVNATAYLNLTFNPTPIVASGDATLAVWSGAAPASPALTGVTVTVFQYYYDQLPVAQNGAPVLPIVDLGTIYELKNTTLTGMAAAQDFPLPYSNFRDFLSTWVNYDNGGTLANPQGSDINYWKLTTANFTDVWKLPPTVLALEARELMRDDPPKQWYYFDTRNKPISTVQFGNMNLVFNANGAPNSGAQLLVGYEDFAQVNTIVGAASLSVSG